jgi:hypothetical protein
MTRKKKRMSKLKLHIVYLVIIAVLALILGLVLKRPEKVITETKYLTDTTFVERIDTVEITKIVEVEKRVVDTTYIIVRDSILVPIPLSEYRFFQKGLYDITAYGYNVSLSNITVFPKTVYQTVINTVEKEVMITSWDIYGGFGIWRFKEEWIPNIGLAVKAPKNLLFTANLGYYDKDLLCGGTLYYNFGKK